MSFLSRFGGLSLYGAPKRSLQNLETLQNSKTLLTEVGLDRYEQLSSDYNDETEKKFKDKKEEREKARDKELISVMRIEPDHESYFKQEYPPDAALGEWAYEPKKQKRTPYTENLTEAGMIENNKFVQAYNDDTAKKLTVMNEDAKKKYKVQRSSNRSKQVVKQLLKLEEEGQKIFKTGTVEETSKVKPAEEGVGGPGFGRQAYGGPDFEKQAETALGKHLTLMDLEKEKKILQRILFEARKYSMYLDYESVKDNEDFKKLCAEFLASGSQESYEDKKVTPEMIKFCEDRFEGATYSSEEVEAMFDGSLEEYGRLNEIKRKIRELNNKLSEDGQVIAFKTRYAAIEKSEKNIQKEFMRSNNSDFSTIPFEKRPDELKGVSKAKDELGRETVEYLNSKGIDLDVLVAFEFLSNDSAEQGEDENIIEFAKHLTEDKDKKIMSTLNEIRTRMRSISSGRELRQPTAPPPTALPSSFPDSQESDDGSGFVLRSAIDTEEPPPTVPDPPPPLDLFMHESDAEEEGGTQPVDNTRDFRFHFSVDGQITNDFDRKDVEAKGVRDLVLMADGSELINGVLTADRLWGETIDKILFLGLFQNAYEDGFVEGGVTHYMTADSWVWDT